MESNLPTTLEQCRAFIDARPDECYRTVEQALRTRFPDLSWQDARYVFLLADARPECGYRCDGGEGPHPANGSPGCFYSGRVEG